VPAFFELACLVLNVDTGGTLFDKETRELGYRGEATMSGIAVGNNRPN
jgi:hypothetical protein